MKKQNLSNFFITILALPAIANGAGTISSGDAKNLPVVRCVEEGLNGDDKIFVIYPKNFLTGNPATDRYEALYEYPYFNFKFSLDCVRYVNPIRYACRDSDSSHLPGAFANVSKSIFGTFVRINVVGSQLNHIADAMKCDLFK